MITIRNEKDNEVLENNELKNSEEIFAEVGDIVQYEYLDDLGFQYTRTCLLVDTEPEHNSDLYEVDVNEKMGSLLHGSKVNDESFYYEPFGVAVRLKTIAISKAYNLEKPSRLR